MSLLLRKAAETTLESHGLPQFHVEVDNYTKHLVVVNECGKVLFTINGIVFNRSVPSKTEIDYAVTLLDAYIATHKPIIMEAISSIRTRNAYPEVPHQDIFQREGTVFLRHYRNNDGNMSIRFKRDKRWSISHSSRTCWPKDLLKQLALNKSMEKKLDECFKWADGYDTACKSVDDAKAALNKCTI